MRAYGCSVLSSSTAGAPVQHEPPEPEEAEIEDQQDRRRSSVAMVKPCRIVVMPCVALELLSAFEEVNNTSLRQAQQSVMCVLLVDKMMLEGASRPHSFHTCVCYVIGHLDLHCHTCRSETGTENTGP